MDSDCVNWITDMHGNHSCVVTGMDECGLCMLYEKKEGNDAAKL